MNPDAEARMEINAGIDLLIEGCLDNEYILVRQLRRRLKWDTNHLVISFERSTRMFVCKSKADILNRKGPYHLEVIAREFAAAAKFLHGLNALLSKYPDYVEWRSK